jgi:ABC-type cobalamin/Fe3+-siderophores transport system ATPase subunit
MEPPILDICNVCYKINNKLILNHILVTQHIEEIMPVFDRVAALKEGKVIEQGPKEDVLSTKLIRRLYGVSARVLSSAGRYWMVCE